MPLHPRRLLAKTQGIFYLVTGVWPLLHMASFERVTGPKTDHWLVRTVGVLIAVIGAALLVGARRDELAPELQLLAAGSAAGLAGIDLVYVARRRISPVYLLDALVEMVLVGGWAAFPYRSGDPKSD